MTEFLKPVDFDLLPRAVMDYSTLTVIGRLASEKLIDARLRRVTGTRDGSIIFAFDRFSDDGDKDHYFDAWLFSADPKLFRVHPWPDVMPGKSVASHLLEVISHHLTGAKVTAVDVTKFERILNLHFTKREYTGEESTYTFIAELMGKHSNMILIDSDSIILASHKPVHSYQSRFREIRAGKDYTRPPRQDRIEPREFIPTEWSDFLGSAEMDIDIDQHIAGTFMGMSRVWAMTICLLAGIKPGTKVTELLLDDSEKLRQTLALTTGMVTTGVPLSDESPDEFVRRVTADFLERADDIAVEKARQGISKIIGKRRKKLRALEKGLTRDLDKAAKAEKYKKRADLLLANQYRITPGMNELEIDDWETGEKVVLEIDPSINPPLQSEMLYDRYRKLKRTLEVATERLAGVVAEDEELTRLEDKLARAEHLSEINDVRELCILHGLISPPDVKAKRGPKAHRKRQVQKQALTGAISSRRYRSNDGFLIMAGLNDRANDALRRSSNPEDIWLHTRNIPGSHVYIITRGKAVPETTIREAAMVAAWHSKARDGSHVPVDYTKAKYVTPIAGARAGKVTFRRERTIRVNPDEKRIEMMGLMAGDVDK